MKLMNVRVWWVLVGMVAAFVGGIASTTRVTAISASGPDTAEFGGANVVYYLANTADVAGAVSTGVPVYLPSAPAGNVTIGFWCDNRPRGVRVTTPVVGRTTPWTMCGNRTGEVSGSFSIPASEFRFNPDSKMYKAVVGFSLVSNSERRGFRLTFPGGLIGYSSTENNERFAVMNEDRCRQANNNGCGKYFTYSLPFAAPCSRPTERASIIVYDLDNDASGSTDGAQYGRKMTAYVRDTDTGELQIFDISASGNGVAQTLEFTSTKGHRYSFVLVDVYTNNVIQFKLPYDSINALSRCTVNNLLPSTQVSGAEQRTISAGESVTPTEVIHNSGEKADYSSKYAAYQFVIPRGKSFGFAGVFDQVIDGYKFALADYADTGNACSDWLRTLPGALGNINCGAQTVVGDQIFPSGDTAINDTVAIRADDYAIGDTVCRMLVVRSFDFANVSSTKRRVSYPACVKIARKPLVQIWGNDLRAGSAPLLTDNRVSGVRGAVFGDGSGASPVYGSWVEYGITAPGVVGDMASGSGLNKGGAVVAPATWSKLTFSNNAVNLGEFGSATQVGPLPNIKGYFTGSVVPKGVTRRDVTDVTLTSSDYVANLVIYATGTVTINSSLNAPNNNIGIGEQGVEQVVIIAKDIRISESVDNIDAWLIAPEGTIDTCYEHTGALTMSDCKDNLKITGAVVAKQILLKRTFGTKGAAAEVFNMRGDSYIWARRISAANGVWKTKSITDLPPRY